MRLIDADALKAALVALHGHGDYEAHMYCAETCYGLGKWVWEDPEDYGIEAAEKALEAAPTVMGWNVLRVRKMTDEEWEAASYEERELNEAREIIDGKLPDDGQEILVSLNGFVSADVFGMDGDMCYLESYGEIVDGMAWMPMPEPYKGDEE